MSLLRAKNYFKNPLSATTHLCTRGIHNNMFCGAIIRIAGLFNYFIRRGIWLRTIDNIVCLPAEYLQSFHHPLVTLNNGGEQYNITLYI